VKILIIGGGPAGSTAAKLLAPFHDVTLIQDKPDFDKPCGGGVKTEIFRQFDIPSDPVIHTLNHVIMKYKRESVNVDLKGDNLSIVKRKKFDQILRTEAQNAGAKLYYGKFKHSDSQRAYIKIAKETIPFEYDILIGADGVYSSVRKSLNLPKIPSTITHYAKTQHYSCETCEFFFDYDIAGEYYAWAFPHGNLTHIGTVNRENFENLCKYLRIDIKPKGYSIPTWQEDIIIQKENVFFVGDAAGQVMPLSFEGIYYAIKSAEVLAESIIEKKDYKQEWNKKFLKDFNFMKKLESLNKTKLRPFIIKAHKLTLIQNLSIKLWLGE